MQNQINCKQKSIIIILLIFYKKNKNKITKIIKMFFNYQINLSQAQIIKIC
jgi:hypothetical protein